MWRRAFVLLAVALLSVFSSFAQGSYDGHLAQARSLIGQQKFGDAVTEAEKAIAIDGQRWEGYVIAAKGYSSQTLYDDAIGMLQLALARAPEDKKPAVRDAIAECRKEQNQGNAPNPSKATPASGSAPTIGPKATTPTQAEIVLWKSIENSGNPDDFKAYMHAYPSGAFVPLARSRLASYLQKKQADLWKRIENSDDSDDFKGYLDAYPNGAFVSQARSRFALYFQKQAFDRATRFYAEHHFAEAAPAYQTACDGGDARGCSYLGHMYESGQYESGQGVVEDANHAALLFQKGCEGGDASGCSYLGHMYESGQGGVAKDVNHAALLYLKGCAGGDTQACKNLSILKGRPSK